MALLSGHARLFDALLAGVPWDHELALIEETVEVASDPAAFPHLHSEMPSPAPMWRRHKFDDSDVERWLEVGVWSADAAAELRDAGIDRKYIAAEHSAGVTLGWAFCARLVTLEEVASD